LEEFVNVIHEKEKQGPRMKLKRKKFNNNKTYPNGISFLKYPHFLKDKLAGTLITVGDQVPFNISDDSRFVCRFLKAFKEKKLDDTFE